MNLLQLKEQHQNDSPYKVVRRDAIEYVGRLDDGDAKTDSAAGFASNVYRVDGSEVLVSDSVSRQLDCLIGLKPRQARVVQKASGSEGIRVFRNYLATANSITKPVTVALVANPASHTVSGIIPIGTDVIPFDAFIDFAQMFTEKNGLVPVRQELAYDITNGVTIFLDGAEPEIRQFAPNEEFRINGYYLKWNLGQIELGRYFERLVCTNGQTVKIKEREARIQSLRAEAIQGFLAIPGRRDLLDESFRGFSFKALEAMEVKASMAELKLMSDKLDNYAVDSMSAAVIAPYKHQLNLYADFGYDVDNVNLRDMKAGMTVWELYNGVTDYASNTADWDADDNRRGMLQGEAYRFLMATRDIRNYKNVFGD